MAHEIQVTDLDVFNVVNLCVIVHVIDYLKYDIHQSNSLTDIRQKH